MNASFSKRSSAAFRNVCIAGSGRFLPGSPVDNDTLIGRFGINTSDAWIQGNIGIKTRHFADEKSGSSDLAFESSKIALEKAGIDAEELQRIVFCSSTADWTSPAAASNLQQKLGASCPSHDVQAACASFLFGLDHGLRLVQTGLDNVLVASGEKKSSFVGKNDHRLLPIFGDGAASFLLTACEDENAGFSDCELWTDGSCLKNMITPAGGSAMPASTETVEKDLHTTRMQVDGKKIFQDAVQMMTELSRRVCEKNGVNISDVDLFIPHQANRMIMEKVGESLGISPEKTVMTIQETGNIVSASIPYSYDFALEKGMIQKQSLILMTAVGAGYAGGSVLYRVP